MRGAEAGMETTRSRAESGPGIALVGGGRLACAFLDAVGRERPLLLGVADLNDAAPGLRHARERGLVATPDFRDLYGLPGLEVLVEATGDDAVLEELLRTRPAHVTVLDHTRARLIAEGAASLAAGLPPVLLPAGPMVFCREILDAVGDGVAIIDRNFQVVMANTAFRRLAGAVQEKCLRGQTRPCQECAVRCTFETGQPQTATVALPDGRLIEMRTYPIGDGREPMLVIEHVRDITERKRAEERLRWLSRIAEQVGEGVAVADAELRVSFVNEAWVRMHGWSREEVIGQPTRIFHTTEQMRQEVEPALEEVWRTGQWSGEMGHMDRQGRVFPTQMTATLLKDEEGKPLGVIAFAVDVSERKRAASALEQSEEKYRSLVEESVMGVYLIQDGLFRFVNRCLAEVFGYERGEIIDRLGPLDLVAPEDRPLVSEKIRQRLEGETASVRYTFRGLTRQGERIDVEVVGSRTIWQGRPAVHGSLMDITEQRRAQQALEESEARYRVLVDNALVGVFRTTTDGRIVYVNQAAASMLGYGSPEELLRLRTADLHLTPEARQAGQAALKATGKISGLEVDVETKQGGTRTLLVSATLRGDILDGMAVDITERTRAEEALRESEERYRLLVESSPDCIKLLDIEGRYLSLNRRGIEAVGRPLEEIIGRHYANDFDPADQPTLREALRQAARGDTVNVEAASGGDAPPGIVWLVSLVPLRDRRGRVERLLGVARDVSGIRRAEEAMRRANEELARLNRLKDEFLSMASHELKTPVTSIKIYAQLALRKPEVAAPELPRMLATIDRQADRLVSLVNDLLDVSRLNLDRVPLVLAPCDLRAILEDLCIVSAQLYPDHPLYCPPPASPAVIRCDRSRLMQVLHNLVDNAAKYSPPGAPIDVGVEVGPRSVTIAVRDRGPGIAPEDLPHIFERFYKARAQQAVIPGLGLGLYIGRELVQRHGGRIWAESEPGRGSTLYVELPLELPLAEGDK